MDATDNAAVNSFRERRRVDAGSGTETRPRRRARAGRGRGYTRGIISPGRGARARGAPCVTKEARESIQEYISSSRRCSPGTGVDARLLGGLSAFIAPGWLRMSFCLRATGMQLNARRRWRGKKHVPDSQNRGAVTRRCCGARRPIDHQSLPSRMRRSLPHDFGVPTPKRVPYIVYTISLRLALSLLSPLPRLSPSPFLILFSPRSRSSSLRRSARSGVDQAVALPPGNVAPDEASRPGPARHSVYLGGAMPAMAWRWPVALADRRQRG